MVYCSWCGWQCHTEPTDLPKQLTIRYMCLGIQDIILGHTRIFYHTLVQTKTYTDLDFSCQAHIGHFEVGSWAVWKVCYYHTILVEVKKANFETLHIHVVRKISILTTYTKD